jgi:hypothetical protein
MKYTKLFVLVVFVLTAVLTACVTVSTPVPTAMPTHTPEAGGTPTLTVTPDSAKGTIEGRFSWSQSKEPNSVPMPGVTLQLDRHSGEYIKYKVKTEADGHYVFANIEPGNYGFGIYLNLQLSERVCEHPEYIHSQDLGWTHYATWLKIDVYYDVLFSSTDITVKPGDVVVLDLELKCP